jgi:FkbM family methyltransferase
MKDLVAETGPDIEIRPDGPPFIKSRGIRFPNDKRIINARNRRALRSGDYERREAEAVKAHVGPEDVVIELGAGMGYMSAFMAKNLGARQIHAFEANPGLIPYIEAVYAANGITNARVTNAVLGPRKGKVDFHVRKNFLASSLDPDPKGVKSAILSVEKIEVQNAKAVFRDIRPTVLVCDIEGAEADLLPAADLSSLRVAIVELHPQWIGQAGVQAVFNAMQAAGLTYFPRTSDKKVVTFKKGW